MRRQIRDDHRNWCYGWGGPKHHVAMPLQNLNGLLQRSFEFVGWNFLDAGVHVRFNQIPQAWKSPATRALLKPSGKSSRIAAEERRRNSLILRMMPVGNRDCEVCQVRRHTT